MKGYVAIPEERMELLKADQKWRWQLKKFSDVKVELQEDVFIDGGDPIAVMRAKLVFQAFGRGFDFDVALSLLDEEYNLEIIDLSSYSKSRDRMHTLKGRVIGTRGKIRSHIEKKTETKIAVYGKTIALIGKFENTQKAREAIEMILSGSKHGTVLRFLE